MKDEKNIKETTINKVEDAGKVAVKDEELKKTTGGIKLDLGYSDDEKDTGNGTIYGSAKK
ncbi:hypothetical protein [Butyrivibrio sp. FCS014]|uniref:hypothetical protein n=1 Tax=Butyrivibrio sp. FCS014 TaxID=1408304 RepID=UPI00046353AA|nr:hypothetical protein [Butyrivibrio sp. FCS014]